MYWYFVYYALLVRWEVPVRGMWTSLLDSFCLILTGEY